MKITKNDFCYFSTEQDLTFGEQITLDGELLIPISTLDKIRAEIESNMESIIGKYDSSIPKSNMPSYKIERNKVREECIFIIDKYKADKGERRMNDYGKYINALRKCAKEHAGDYTVTGCIRVSDLCNDTADLLESLEKDEKEE